MDEYPDYPDGDGVLERAAIALERAGRRHAAVTIYERITQRVRQRAPARHPHRARDDDAILQNALHRRAFLAMRAFEHERAVSLYDQILTNDRFMRSDDPEMRRRILYTLLQAADLHAQLGNWGTAARLYRRVADRADERRRRNRAILRVAEMERRAGRPARALRTLRRWRATDAWFIPPHVEAEAWLATADAWQQLGDAERRDDALQGAVTLAEKHPHDDVVAHWAGIARTRLERARAQAPPLDSFAAGRHLPLMYAPPPLAH